MAVVDDIYSVKLFSRITPAAAGSQVAINVLHYQVTVVAGNPKNDQQIADALSLFWGPPYSTYLSDQASFRGVICQRIFPLPQGLAVSSTDGQAVGIAPAGELLPPQITGIITKQTALSGRRNRGRVYMPFPGELDSTASVPDATYLARLNIIVPFFVSEVAVGVLPDRTVMTPVIFHRSTPAATTIISSAVRRPYFATQRRRSWVSGADVSPIG